MKRIIIWVCVSALIPLSVYANQKDEITLTETMINNCEIALNLLAGEKGLERLNQVDALRAGMCMGYIEGAVQINLQYEYYLHKEKDINPIFCLPAGGLPEGGVDNIQLIKIALKYLKQSPTLLTRDLLIREAFVKAFPCE